MDNNHTTEQSLPTSLSLVVFCYFTDCIVNGEIACNSLELPTIRDIKSIYIFGTLVIDGSKKLPNFSMLESITYSTGSNVKCVGSMHNLFYGSPFNGDISGWNVSSVTNMSHMFYGTPFNRNMPNW